MNPGEKEREDLNMLGTISLFVLRPFWSICCLLYDVGAGLHCLLLPLSGCIYLYLIIPFSHSVAFLFSVL